MIVPQFVLAWLVNLANSDPSYPDSFYDLKHRLLKRFAKFDRVVNQRIVHECWGDRYGNCGAECPRCWGSGVWNTRYYALLRYKWSRYTFLVPVENLHGRPDSIDIEGKVIHQDYGKASTEAELWLYLVTGEFRTWWHVMTTSGYFVNSSLYPLCQLQRWIVLTRSYFGIKKCIRCKGRFLSRRSGWQVCKKCRVKKIEVPF